MSAFGSAWNRAASLERLVDRACRPTGRHREVTAVRIVPGRRPLRAEAFRFRLLAEVYGVPLTIDGDGTITLRRPTPGGDAGTRRDDADGIPTWRHALQWLAGFGQGRVTPKGVR